MEDDNEESPYIKLISAENSEIYLSRRIALQVETLRVMLEGNFRESEEGVIRFPDISASALEKVVKYLYYKDRYSNSATRIPEFPIDPEEVCGLNFVYVYVMCYGFCIFCILILCISYSLHLITIVFGTVSCCELSELLGGRFAIRYTHLLSGTLFTCI